jgi:hypothetical protein
MNGDYPSIFRYRKTPVASQKAGIGLKADPCFLLMSNLPYADRIRCPSRAFSPGASPAQRAGNPAARPALILVVTLDARHTLSAKRERAWRKRSGVTVSIF